MGTSEQGGFRVQAHLWPPIPLQLAHNTHTQNISWGSHTQPEAKASESHEECGTLAQGYKSS